jgi:hypothetical protein
MKYLLDQKTNFALDLFDFRLCYSPRPFCASRQDALNLTRIIHQGLVPIPYRT